MSSASVSCRIDRGPRPCRGHRLSSARAYTVSNAVCSSGERSLTSTPGPDRIIRTYSVFRTPDHGRTLAKGNADPPQRRTVMTTPERPATLCEAFQRTASIDPDAVALRTPGDTQTLTWRELADQVRKVAAGLAGLGVRRGDTVSLMMANRIEFYPLEIGAQHVGATSFSVYNTLPAEQVTYLFGNAGTKVAICE